MTDPHTPDDSETTDTSFVPHLDARQRAMLAEMGIKVWAPRPALPVAAPAASESQPRVPPTRAPAPRPETPRPPAPPAAETAPETPGRPHRPDVAALDWPTLQATVTACQACGLCKSRRNTVFGAGDPQADWMIVGEAPGEHEDLQGEPFVGAAGQLLDNMLRAMGLSRASGAGAGDAGLKGAYIANVLKCRPPANRNPLPEEVAQCEPYLARQVALVQPKIIIAMGRFAVQSLLRSDEPIGRLRGRVHRFEGVPVVVTYHPAYLLRTPADKAKAWADLCLAMETVQDAAG